MASEITEEEEDLDSFRKMEKEAQKNSIRRIIEYQKYLFSSSSSCSSSISTSSSTPASSSSFSFSRKSNLLNLMKDGSTSLRRLFDMEHTSLSTHFQDYSGSPIIKPILLWGSDSDQDGIHDDPWNSIKQHRQQQQQKDNMDESKSHGQRGVVASKDNFSKQDFVGTKKKQRFGRKKLLNRTRSFRKLPRFRFNLWRWGGFRLRRMRILFCGRVNC